MDTEHDYDPTQTAGDRSNQSIIIDNGKYVAAVVVCAALCGASWVFAWHAAYVAEKADTQYQVMLNHQMYLENQMDNLKEKKDAVRSQ